MLWLARRIFVFGMLIGVAGAIVALVMDSEEIAAVVTVFSTVVCAVYLVLTCLGTKNK